MWDDAYLLTVSLSNHLRFILEILWSCLTISKCNHNSDNKLIIGYLRSRNKWKIGLNYRIGKTYIRWDSKWLSLRYKEEQVYLNSWVRSRKDNSLFMGRKWAKGRR